MVNAKNVTLVVCNVTVKMNVKFVIKIWNWQPGNV